MKNRKYNPYPGKFIVFEGLDGSGQTTQAVKLQKWLNSSKDGLLLNKGAHLTKEPTNNIIGGLIRGQLTGDWKTSPECLQLLYSADRAHHLEKEIIPLLKKGVTVITDRYFFSTFAFGASEIDVEWLIAINKPFILPDITILIKVSPQVCMERINQERFNVELFEKKEVLNKVWKNYENIASRFENIHIIDGEQPIEKVFSDIKNLISLKLKKNMPKIFIIDEFTSQDNAMLQALYSRSPNSVAEHIEKVRNAKSGNFMEKFYVGYGHSSIADCGSTTIFIEGLSILADKAVQDWPLYSGQETSTRYVDMSKQSIIDPVQSPQSKEILDNWMNFYVSSQLQMEEFLMSKYPRKPEEKEEVYQKAIKARVFDIMRGFLPAGITTQLSWHTNLRQAHDKLSWLRHNPIPEIREIAETILAMLKEKYPQSFSHQIDENQENFRKETAKKYNFFFPDKISDDVILTTNIDGVELSKYQDIINNRPPKTGLPHFLAELGTLTFDFLLDFGSFRDIQRHRNGVCRMPLLTTNLEFNDWYLNELPENLKIQAQDLISRQRKAIDELDSSPELKQYYIALGFNVPCRVTYGLPATAYVVELRSGRLVHPTLRKVALRMREVIHEKFPNLILHCDLSPSQWDVSRGLQDITERK